MSLMISVSGIRGIFGSDLNPENLVTWSAAFGAWLGGGPVVIGRDTRNTGKICEDIVASTLKSVGCDVIRTGIVPTPTVAMAVLRHEARGGIILTASHNPEEWNALKLLNEKSEFLDAAQGETVRRIAEEKQFEFVAFDQIGRDILVENATDDHIQAILDLPYIHPDKLAERKFKVAVDAVNGAGSEAVPALLESLGARVYKLHCTPDGRFPHNPEPLPEHLSEIREFVLEHDCDLGVVLDPDADRLALIDEKGELFGEENTQVTAFDFMLAYKPGPTATNLSSSRSADDITLKYNQKCYRSAVGEINVVKKMQEVEAVIGGEGNGGVINPDLHYGRDALAGIAMTLQLLADRGLKASDYRSTLPSYRIIKEKISLEEMGKEADELLATISQRYADHSPDTTDGVKIDLDKGWVHFRKSNTEPVVRVYAEAKSEEQARELADELIRSLNIE